jgi:hypothetical protein
MGNAAKIAKYLLFIAGFFSILALAHLAFAYVYGDADIMPKKGGTISVGMVGDAPSLNPLRFGLGGSNDVLLGFLYRSLLRYDIDTREITGDLANCDLGKNFGLVKCYPNPGIVWQDGTPITKSDILATFATLRESRENPAVNAILDKVTITDRGEYVEFATDNPDAEIVSLLTFPIVSQSMLGQSGGAVTGSGVKTSGVYSIAGLETDDDYGSTNVTLVRNESLRSESPIYVGRYVFRFFADEATLRKNEEILDLIVGSDATIPPDSPRFVRTDTLFPDQIALFLNAEKVPASIRNLVLFQLGRTPVEHLDPARGKVLSDIFFAETGATVQLAEKNIAKTFGDLGFYTRDRLVELFEKDIAALEAGSTGAVATEAAPIPTLSAFDTPSREAIHFSTGTSAGELSIGGNVPAGVTAVYVNDYKLAKFTAGGTRFSYLARVSMANLKEGANSYKLSFAYADGSRKDIETLTVYYSADPAKLATMRTGVLAARKPVVSAADPVESQKRLSTLKQSLGQARDLDPKYYYNRDFVRFTLDLLYTSQSGVSPVLVDNVRDSLGMIGIYLNSREINIDEIKEIVRTGEKKYDALLTGINLGIFGYNVFPFFHSGQAKGGLNFSGIKNVKLDIELERLKTRIENGENLDSVRSSISSILAREAIIRPYYSAYANWFVDRTIRGRLDVRVVPSAAFLHELLEPAFVSERYDVDWHGKSLLGFVRWIDDRFDSIADTSVTTETPVTTDTLSGAGSTPDSSDAPIPTAASATGSATASGNAA